MANSGSRSHREWQRLEGPLLELDPVLSEFADEFSLELKKNHKGAPDRSFFWGDSIHRLIQIYLMDEKQLTFNLWLCAWQDRNGKRYWKEETLVESKPISGFKDSLPGLLREGKSSLDSWGDSDLEFATNVSVP